MKTFTLLIYRFYLPLVTIYCNTIPLEGESIIENLEEDIIVKNIFENKQDERKDEDWRDNVDDISNYSNSEN